MCGNECRRYRPEAKRVEIVKEGTELVSERVVVDVCYYEVLSECSR